jgi:ecotin
MKSLATTLLMLVFAMPVSEAADNLRAFPPAAHGMGRFVLQLPPQPDEHSLKVELLIGKMVAVDEHNRHFFAGTIEEQTIKGWGFTAYRVNQPGPMAGTLMAVDPNAPKVARFVPLRGDPFLIRYNSRLPVVVYVPEGVEVRYRIWAAGGDLRAMEKGLRVGFGVAGAQVTSGRRARPPTWC